MAILASVLLLPAIARAQPINGLYVNFDTGINIAGTLMPVNDKTKVETSLGPAVVVDLGWGFGQGLRAEIEGNAVLVGLRYAFGGPPQASAAVADRQEKAFFFEKKKQKTFNTLMRGLT